MLPSLITIREGRMKQSLGIALITLVVAGLAAVQAQQQAPALKIEQVKDNLFVISESGGNVAVRVTPEGVILIDDKFERNFDEIMQRVKSVTGMPVKYVINTHQHGDHTGSNVQFIKTAEIIAHKNARANMVRTKQMDTPPRITFGDETAVYLGGAEVQAHYYGRGHTNGDAVIYFPDLRVVHMGDLFTAGFPYIDYENGGSFVEWTKTIDAALALDFDTAIPGHGPVMKKADLQMHRNKIETVRQRVRELIAKGVSKEQFVAQLKLDDLGWTLNPNAVAYRSLPRLYDELSKS
jgi:glyoxylase-like metal-dependent hydrolase (beta-lactamase superfamily II)